jgi:hypothetical protein
MCVRKHPHVSCGADVEVELRNADIGIPNGRGCGVGGRGYVRLQHFSYLRGMGRTWCWVWVGLGFFTALL